MIKKILSRFMILGIIPLLIFGLAACRSISGSGISVKGAWGRPSPKVVTNGAVYMTIKNTGSETDKLISVTSASCGVVELHESYDMGDGVMGMRPVEGGYIEVPAGGEIVFKMGGLHFMCIDKLDEFKQGAVLSFTLEFEKSDDMTVDVEIHQPDR